MTKITTARLDRMFEHRFIKIVDSNGKQGSRLMSFRREEMLPAQPRQRVKLMTPYGPVYPLVSDGQIINPKKEYVRVLLRLQKNNHVKIKTSTN